MRKFLAVLFVCLLAIPLAAQTRTGNIYGTVVDGEGTPLPGVSVTLTGPTTATMAKTTSAAGKFRFLSLFPGNLYEVRAELEGFKTKLEKGVIVNHSCCSRPSGRRFSGAAKIVVPMAKVNCSIRVIGAAATK